MATSLVVVAVPLVVWVALALSVDGVCHVLHLRLHGQQLLLDLW